MRPYYFRSLSRQTIDHCWAAAPKRIAWETSLEFTDGSPADQCGGQILRGESQAPEPELQRKAYKPRLKKTNEMDEFVERFWAGDLSSSDDDDVVQTNYMSLSVKRVYIRQWS